MEKGKKNLHDEHRKRVRAELKNNTLNENSEPHKILEMLLFYSIPRCDTNEMAHMLLEEFGSIQGVLEAEVEDLMKIKGIGENSALFFKLVRILAGRYVSDKKSARHNFAKIGELYEYLVNLHLTSSNEVIRLTSLDGKGAVIATDILNEGDVSSVSVPTRKVIELVLKRKAVYVILSHNHPNGNAIPSIEDVSVTREISEVLQKINVKLLDHIIISGGDYVSMRQSTQYKSIFQ